DTLTLNSVTTFVADHGHIDLYAADGAGSLASPYVYIHPLEAHHNGTTVAMTGDMNSDGFSDLIDFLGPYVSPISLSVRTIISAAGAVIDARPQIHRQALTFNGTPIALQGLVTGGNGFNLGMRARSAAGRKLITGQYQVGDLAQPFSSLPVNTIATVNGGAPD